MGLRGNTPFEIITSFPLQPLAGLLGPRRTRDHHGRLEHEDERSTPLVV